MKTIITLCMVLSTSLVKAQITEDSKPIPNSLETYQPLPIEEIRRLKDEAYKNAANQAKRDISNFLDYYYSIKSFKTLPRGGYSAKIIFNSEMIADGKIFINNNRVFEIDVAGGTFMEANGLKVNSEIVNGHTKVFFEKNGTYTPIEIYIPSTFQ